MLDNKLRVNRVRDNACIMVLINKSRYQPSERNINRNTI